MRVHHNMSNEAFIRLLREGAIASKLGPLVIDAIDKLDNTHDQSERIEELEDEVKELESEIRELQDQLDDKPD